ncbi:uncharacterized protein LOC106166962, partial [Lingula anatina]|uniref:Uncharacterized protein LOC106166962 n=1 Tax=Lingula anatina TaxID=7574 RepID=A0A1S3IU70_LINAN
MRKFWVVGRTSTSSNSPCSAPNEGMFSVIVVGGSVESSASSPSPSFLKKAQEIKDKERNKEKDSKENIPAPIEEETTKRNSIEVQVRSPRTVLAFLHVLSKSECGGSLDVLVWVFDTMFVEGKSSPPQGCGKESDSLCTNSWQCSLQSLAE